MADLQQQQIEQLVQNHGLTLGQATAIVNNNTTVSANDSIVGRGIDVVTGIDFNALNQQQEGYNTPTEATGIDLSGDIPDSNQGPTGAIDLEKVKQQSNIRDIERTGDDWRFRMRLAPRSQVLYKSGDPGILQPLVATDGVIFPYTPQVTVNYQANYSGTAPTHSNYKQYFYQSSEISDIQITGEFTAQSNLEADYLLATIHFLRSCTKMFYGQDDNRGAPPPLVYLDGFGEHQFNDMPCVIQQFNYILPNNVDYVRTSGDTAVNPLNLQAKSVGPTAYKSPLRRLYELFSQGIGKGGVPTQVPTGNNINQSLSRGQQNYVPTKIEIAITLHPIVTRKKQSTEFSLGEYASGKLLKGGHW